MPTITISLGKEYMNFDALEKVTNLELWKAKKVYILFSDADIINAEKKS